MSEFYVGQKVVCINDGPPPDELYRPYWRGWELLKRGSIYTILSINPNSASIFQDAGSIGLRLAENKVYWYGHEYWYGTRRFRPLDSKAISMFRKIASDVTAGKKVEIVE